MMCLGNLGRDMPHEERLKLLKWPMIIFVAYNVIRQEIDLMD